MEQLEFNMPPSRAGEQLELFEAEPNTSFIFSMAENSSFSKLLSINSSPTVTFYDKDSGKTGSLNWKDGVFRFEGAAEESALVFFTHVLHSVNTSAKIYKDTLEKYRGVADKNGIYSADCRFMAEAYSAT